MIHLVPVAEIDRVWPLLHRGMDIACRKARSRMTAVDIYQACRNGAYFLHVVVEDDQLIAGVATQVTGDVVTVYGLYGRDMARWLPELINLDLWKMLGVTKAAWGGRVPLGKIVSKTMPHLNLRHVRSDFEVELPHAS